MPRAVASKISSENWAGARERDDKVEFYAIKHQPLCAIIPLAQEREKISQFASYCFIFAEQPLVLLKIEIYVPLIPSVNIHAATQHTCEAN